MLDNYTNDISELLIKYMDNELSPDEKTAVEKMLHEDADVNERYQHLLAAKQAIRHQNLKQRVRLVHDEYISERANNINITKTKTPSIFKTFMRVAAVFIAVIAGYGVFEYSTTTTQSIFNDNYISYQLPVNRGADETDEIDSLYAAKNYTAVVNAFEQIPQKSQEDYFIAGQSYLSLDNTDKAIKCFLDVKKINNSSAQKYFVDETDYYLALAYLKAGNIDEAENLLNKITADKQNLYYKKAKDISGYKLRILKLKK